MAVDGQLEPRTLIPLQLAGFMLALLGSGCGTGHLVTRAEAPELTATDGFIAMAVETNKRCALTLCRDADLMHCVTFAGMTATHSLAVSVVPAGSYCLTTIVAEDPGGGMAYVMNFEADNTTCFKVSAGRIAYPGHLVLSDGEGGGMGWDDEGSITAELRAAYPKLARWPVLKVAVEAR